jgi:hypothetical protein
MASEQRGYHSYLLRLWRAGNGHAPEWRIVLEEVRTNKRHSFASVTQLAAFLDGQMRGVKDDSAALDPRDIPTTYQKGGQAMRFFAITLSPGKNERAFERFMLEEIFPTIPKNMRRDGQVTGLVLLKGNNTGRTNEYLWLVYGGINGGAASQKVEAIEAFGTTVTRMPSYSHCGSWFADSEGQEYEQPLRTDEGT